MIKIYHLGTCSTCKRIIKELAPGPETVFQDIKNEPITPQQIEKMREVAGSYEQLFNRRAMKYRALGLNEKTLKEEDYKNYILKEYTFLKRPVIIVDEQIFVGNSPKVVAAAKAAF